MSGQRIVLVGVRARAVNFDDCSRGNEKGTLTLILFTMWCPVCNQHTQQAPPNVSVRALILALGRFGIVAAAEVKSLEKRWAKHRKENSLDRNGKPNPALSTGSERQGPERHSHGPT